MKRALDEMDRRRSIQRQHNADFDITPQSIRKSVDEVRFVTRVADARVSESKPEGGGLRPPMDPEAMIEMLEKQMREAAADLDYETAAQLRDQIFELKAQTDPDAESPRRHQAQKKRRYRG